MLYYTIFIYLILLASYITIVCHRKTRVNPDVNFPNKKKKKEVIIEDSIKRY